MSILKSPRSK